MSVDDSASAVAAATRYLASQSSGGLWRGFPTLAGTSDAWVSGFVCAHLAALAPGHVPAHLAETIAALLDRRTSGGGWSYGAGVPDDADSTAWCLRATRDAAPADAAAEATALLEDHRAAGGYATYRAHGGIAEFIGQPRDRVAGWSAPHPDVTAAVLLAGVPPAGGDDEQDVLAWLVSRLSGTGLMPSYWWREELYGTALTLRAVHERGRRLPEDREGVMVRGLRRMQLADGGYGLGASQVADAFTTAMGLEAWCHLAHHDVDGAAGRAAHALLRSQRPDGSWAGGLVMRIPAPALVDPRLAPSWSRSTGGGNSYVPDVDGVFATVMAAHALDLWSRGAPAPSGAPLRSESSLTAQSAGGDEDLVPAPF